MIVKNPALP